jgi:O-antigen/teichoic acid export membrane protein
MADERRSRSTFDRDVLTTVGSRGGVLVLGLLQSVVVARYLAPAGRGQYATLMLIPQTMVALAPLGLQWSLTYYLRRDDFPRQTILRNALALVLLLGLAGFALSLGGAWLVRDTFLAGLTTVALVVVSAFVPFRIGQACWQGVFRGTERILHANVVNTLRPATMLVGATVALVALGGGVTALVIALLAAELLVAAAVVPLAFGGDAVRFGLDPGVARRLLGYGLRIYVFSVLLFINYRLDVAVLRQLSSLEQVGYYATSVGIAEILWAVPASLSFVLFPSVVAADEQRRNVIGPTVARITLAVMVVVAAGIATVALPAIRLLYGEVYLPAVPSLLALLPGVVAMSLQQVLGADVSGRGRPTAVTLAAACGIPVNLALNLWWIPRYGAVGAAWASTVSYTLVTGIVLGFFLRLSGVKASAVLVPRIDDVRDVIARLRRLLRR